MKKPLKNKSITNLTADLKQKLRNIGQFVAEAEENSQNQSVKTSLSNSGRYKKQQENTAELHKLLQELPKKNSLEKYAPNSQKKNRLFNPKTQPQAEFLKERKIDVAKTINKKQPTEKINKKSHNTTTKAPKAEVSYARKKKENSKIKKKSIVFPLILSVALFLVLLYVYTLKIDLDQQKLQAKEKEKENIDFSKDAIFTDVEDDISNEELQVFEDFKDVPDSTTTQKLNTLPKK